MIRRLAIFALLLATAGCGETYLRLLSKGSSDVEGVTSTASGASFATRCGAKASQFSDPSFVIVEQTMSGDFEISGSQGGISFTAALNAKVTVRAKAGISTTETIVSVTNMTADDDGRFSRPRAEEQARLNSNRRTGTGMGTGLLLKLQQSDPAFKNVECSVGFTAESRQDSVAGTGRIRFDPGLPESLNPLADPSTYESELGTTRTFSATATILQQTTDWAPAGTTATVQVTFNKVSPDLTTTAGVPAGTAAIDADVAYEVLATSSIGDVSLLGISKRRVYFINSKTHEIRAIVDDSGKVDKTTQKPLPVVVIRKI